jgi:hypothetical protein
MITPRKSDYPAALHSCTSTLSVFAICAIIWCGVVRALPPQNDAAPSDNAKRQEVVISASKLVDQDTLKHVVLPRFVKSHGTQSERIGQLGRWYEHVCPETVGLRPVSLDGCNLLPSIIDILSADCGNRAKPQGITEADTAYLKALYSSNLETHVNLEQGEMRDQMLKSIEDQLDHPVR